MSFVRTIATCFSKYVSIEGVASRREFWFWLLFISTTLCLALIIDGLFLGPMWSSAMGYEGVMAFDQDAGKPLSIILSLFFIPPTVTVAVRRLHDSDLSGWWLLIGVTVIGLLPLAYIFAKRGKKSPNRYAD